MPSIPTVEHQDGSELRDERLPWVADEFECQQCRHVWVAVRAMGADYTTLECPECGAFDSDFYEPPNEWHPAPTEH